MESLSHMKNKLLLICLLVLGGAIVSFTVFKVSLGNLLFYGILLACPLMHLFMMKGHGGKDDTKQNGKSCH